MAGMWITRLGIKAHAGRCYPEVVLQLGGDDDQQSDANRRGDHMIGAAGPMRGEVWSSLPDDILDRVIARLPLQSLVRMRSVCKKWKIKLRTGSFIRQCELEGVRPAADHWLLTFTAGRSECFAYDTRLAKWHTVPLTFLPFEIGPQSPLAAADGLICLSTPIRTNLLVICNPVSRFWRDVPLPSHLRLISVAGLVVDRVGGAYKLVVLGKDRRNCCTAKHLVAMFMFDSASQRWSTGHELELLVASHFRTTREVLCSVVFDGVLYCLTARPTYQLHVFGILTAPRLRRIIALPAAAEVSAPSLVARPGRLFLVGRYHHNYHDKSSNIGIWELDTNTYEWAVVDILLDHALCTYSHGRALVSISHPMGSRRISKAEHCDDVTLFVKWATRFLAYNVREKSWTWLPFCVSSPASVAAAPASHPEPHRNGFLITPSLLLP